MKAEERTDGISEKQKGKRESEQEQEQNRL